MISDVYNINYSIALRVSEMVHSGARGGSEAYACNNLYIFNCLIKAHRAGSNPAHTLGV